MRKKIICIGIAFMVLFSGLIITVQTPNAAGYVKSTKINTCVSKEERKVSLSWTNISNADGYQIKIARDDDFDQVVGTINTKQKSQTKLSGLTSGKAYYVKMRTCDTINGKKVYSKWSNVKYVKIHKHVYKLKSQTKATCLRNGTKNYQCSCGKKYYKTILKTGHNYKEVVTNSTITYTCLNCNDSYTKATKNNANLDKEYTIKYSNGQTTTVVGHFDTEKANEIFKLTNEYRVKNGLAKLENGNYKLQEAANIRAYEIVKTFSHCRPNGERALTSFTETTGCCAENIGRYQKSAQEVVTAWINSPGHNKNLLKANAEYLSVGVFAEKQSNGTYYYHYVQFFGW